MHQNAHLLTRLCRPLDEVHLHQRCELFEVGQFSISHHPAAGSARKQSLTNCGLPGCITARLFYTDKVHKQQFTLEKLLMHRHPYIPLLK